MGTESNLAQKSETVDITYGFDPIGNSWWIILFHFSINKLSDSDGIAVRSHVYEESLFIAISRRKEKR